MIPNLNDTPAQLEAKRAQRREWFAAQRALRKAHQAGKAGDA